MQCLICQADIREDARFCSQCGAAVTAVCTACDTASTASARFCAACGTMMKAAKPASTPERIEAAPVVERRPLSVLFCDLVGSTSLSSRLDPEELGALIRSYQERVAGTIAAFGGYVARYVGDGILVYFGWPKASEADAEQAVRAALATTDTVAAAAIEGELLRVRIGIATGLVVVGERVRTGETWEQTAFGVTPNRAARLQALAGPGEIVIDGTTRRQIAEMFEIQAMGALALKGLPEPVDVFRVVSMRVGQSRFEALRTSQLTPLVGRQEELDLLQRRWTQATGGQGRVVLVSGEPGIGKSRLLAAFEDHLRRGTFTRLGFFCAPHTQQSPLYPVVRQLADPDARRPGIPT